MSLSGFVQWLADTPWSVQLHESLFGYPLLESVHVLTLCIFVGMSVLLDLRLSEEDGRSVLRHLRGQPEMADTPVFIISGASEVASLSTGTGLDRIDGFFEKPLHLPKLLDTVASVVRPVRSAR